MPIWTTGASAANTSLGTVPKTRVTTIQFKSNGLLPNSQYFFWVNGVDMTWACRTSGTKQGTGLFSDASGSITVLYSCEMYQDTGVESTTKYHSMYLKDISGNVRAVSVTSQTLTGK